MGSREEIDSDDDFSELYKEYTGPVKPNANKTENITPNKKSEAGSDEEKEERDPNAVPTDFTSREAKVWEAKSKATERNWKKRKEEELICKICGESGHFTQGCPSTLGANRKSQDFIERVPARESYVKALFTENVVSKIEKETGSRIKMEEKFIIVSGKDRLILRKGVDAVHKIKEGNEKSKSKSRSRSPDRRSPVYSRAGRSNYSPHRRELQKPSQVRAYDRSRSPARSSYERGPTYMRGTEMQFTRKYEYHHGFPQRLEELELEYMKDAMDLSRIRDKEEDEENYKHREVIREMRENHLKKLDMIRESHAKQWDEFLQNTRVNYNFEMRNYSNSMENYPSESRTYDNYGGQRRDDFGRY